MTDNFSSTDNFTIDVLEHLYNQNFSLNYFRKVLTNGLAYKKKTCFTFYMTEQFFPTLNFVAIRLSAQR